VRLSQFRVYDYRNIHDSGPIEAGRVTAFVGQNESGKSNLFEALYRVNPFDRTAVYDIDEDWPADKWGSRDKSAKVCEAQFDLDGSEIASLFELAGTLAKDADGQPQPALRPAQLSIIGTKSYSGPTQFAVTDTALPLDPKKVDAWALTNAPKFVYIHDYGFSGAQTELNTLHQRKNSLARHQLTNEEQTILIVLDLAHIDIDEWIARGASATGRTIRSFDKRAASAYLSRQFQELWRWRQRDVKFELEIDATTFNIFVTDESVGMPVRLNRRSTGFRWYVSFAWKFTHASDGEFKNCILLLEEPGISLHYSAQADLLQVFERLSEKNSILYTTHLASMVDLGNPERIRIVENDGAHTTVKQGVVSNQRGPMAVIEMALGLTGDIGGLLGHRKTLIVEGGDDALILRKLSSLLSKGHRESLSDEIYIWPARGAPNTPMYAAFAVGQRWRAAVLLDSDKAGAEAAEKIRELYLSKLAEEDQHIFRILMLGKAAEIGKTDCSIEDLFPDEFYLGLVNDAYKVNIKIEDLPVDGSDMITKRIESVLINRFGYSKLDKELIAGQMLKQFDEWHSVSDLPRDTANRAQKLFQKINAALLQP
jgi:energy-coupling factor transporter ATP-binding protein EcfA2